MQVLHWLKWRFWDRISLATAARHGVPMEAWEHWMHKWAAEEPKRRKGRYAWFLQ